MPAQLKKYRKLPRGIRVELFGASNWSHKNLQVSIRREYKWFDSVIYRYRLDVGCESMHLTEGELQDAIALLQEARRLR